MKRTTWVLMAVLLACTLAGCNNAAETGGTTSLAGTTWALDSGEAAGVEVSSDQLFALMGEMSFTFADDSTYSAMMYGANEEGSYTMDGSTVTFDGEMEAVISADEMTVEMDMDGVVVKLIFKKQ